jgi:hypothetical protein
LSREIVEFFQVVLGAPQCQFWLFVGLFAGAIYGLLRRKRLRELLFTTAIIALPPMITVPFVAAIFRGGYPNFMEAIAFVVSIFYIMIGFVGFCIAWIPGVALGYLFGLAARRTGRDSADA